MQNRNPCVSVGWVQPIQQPGDSVWIANSKAQRLDGRIPFQWGPCYRIVIQTVHNSYTSYVCKSLCNFFVTLSIPWGSVITILILQMRKFKYGENTVPRVTSHFSAEREWNLQSLCCTSAASLVSHSDSSARTQWLRWHLKNKKVARRETEMSQTGILEFCSIQPSKLWHWISEGLFAAYEGPESCVYSSTRIELIWCTVLWFGGHRMFSRPQVFT